MKGVFKRFTDIWGDKWSARYTENAKGLTREWGDALKAITKEQIKHAVSRARDKYTWPCSISEFLELCNERESLVVHQSNFLCAINGCSNPGTISEELRGDRWICGHHYRNR